MLFVTGVLLLSVILTKYYEVFGPLFEYLGLRYMPQNESTQIFIYLIVFLLSIILPLNHKKPSNIFLLLLFIMSYLPIAVIFSMDRMASFYGFVFYSLFILALSLLDKIRFKSFEIKTKALSAKNYNLLLFLLISSGAIILVTYYGYHLNVTNYDMIYDVRASFKDKTGGSRLLAFSFSWMANVLVIVLLTISIIKKKWFLVIIAFGLQFYLFNLGGNKSIFMLPFLLIFIIFSAKFFKEYSVLFILYSFVLMCFGLYFYDFIINDNFSLASSIFVRRNFFVPANLFFYYLEFFEFQPADLFAKSFPFSLFMESNYEKDVPYIIGETYIRKGTHANGNFLADLYYNLKWQGFLIGFFFTFIYFRIVDTLVKGKNHLVIVPLATIPVISLMNSGLIVNLVSFGLLLMIFLIALFPKTKYYTDKH